MIGCYTTDCMFNILTILGLIAMLFSIIVQRRVGSQTLWRYLFIRELMPDFIPLFGSSVVQLVICYSSGRQWLTCCLSSVFHHSDLSLIYIFFFSVMLITDWVRKLLWQQNKYFVFFFLHLNSEWRFRTSKTSKIYLASLVPLDSRCFLLLRRWIMCRCYV